MADHPLRPIAAAVGFLAVILSMPAAASADPETVPPQAGTLGQIAPDYEVHGELILVSGQLAGFKEACGFGRSPDRAELLGWYRHYRLARSMARIEGVWDLGVSLGHEAPCTPDHYEALEAHWDRLMARTRNYVEVYRRE